MIIGFDVSTAYIGYCILGDVAQYIELGHFDIRKYKDLYEKFDVVNGYLRDLKKKYDGISKVYVEKTLQRSNNQNVVNLLQRFNGMFCISAYQTFGARPELIEHRTARKAVGIKIPKGVKGLDLKKYILQYVQSLYIIPEDLWELKKTGNPKDFCFDQADAFVVAKAGLLRDEKENP